MYRPSPQPKKFLARVVEVHIHAHLHVVVAEEIREIVGELDPLVIRRDGQEPAPSESTCIINYNCAGTRRSE